MVRHLRLLKKQFPQEVYLYHHYYCLFHQFPSTQKKLKNKNNLFINIDEKKENIIIM